jgi:large subunit ribosomal protein L13
MKTSKVTPANIEKKWVVIDCAKQPLGRVASEIARILRGKHKPSYVPHLDCGDYVIATNIKDIVLTGNKWENKIYYHHTGYIGGIKDINAKDLFAKRPEDLMIKAVKGMLPKNKLANQVIKNLKVYCDSNHPHEAQKPQEAQPRLVKN